MGKKSYFRKVIARRDRNRKKAHKSRRHLDNRARRIAPDIVAAQERELARIIQAAEEAQKKASLIIKPGGILVPRDSGIINGG